ncbi:MAG: hypothetical protein DI527_00620 [Chelatococcus sp.]|nr:MAG: hypothetical protein DI527_00620 [Chelatococcus sp.]
MAPKTSLRDRIVDADTRASMFLADANEADERGNRAKAEKLYEKSQFWRDRYNLLTGNGDRPPPKR